MLQRFYYTLFETEFGWVRLVASENGICQLVWHQPSRDGALDSLGGDAGFIEDSAPFYNLPQRLQYYFGGEKVDFPDRVDLSSITPFQYSTLEIVRSIPYGETRSYSWIAANLRRPQACRAVGQALRRNPIPVIIPCHRVIGANGRLVGFSGGLSLKSLLLNLESQNAYRELQKKRVTTQVHSSRVQGSRLESDEI